MARHRKVFEKGNEAPFELSRSKIESFVKCPGCFWLEKARGVKFPGIPAFLLNTNTDTLLKKDFDRYRGQSAHPVMTQFGLSHLRPFDHEKLPKWINSLHFGAGPDYFNTIHGPSNFLVGGGIDDIWEDAASRELYIVDYKSTAQMGRSPKPLDESFIAPQTDTSQPDYKAAYRRQMDMYQWILRRKGFRVSRTAFFLYVDGQHNNEAGMLDEDCPNQAWMRFNVAIIPYVGDDSWIEGTLMAAKAALEQNSCPAHAKQCEYKHFVDQVNAVANCES